MIQRGDLEQQFGKSEIDQLVGTDAEADTRLADTITRTRMEIESRLSARYELPVTDNEEIREIAGHLVRARLYTHNPPEWVTKEADKRRQYLDEAAKGSRGIKGLTPRGNRRASATRATRTRAERTFTHDTLAGY